MTPQSTEDRTAGLPLASILPPPPPPPPPSSSRPGPTLFRMPRFENVEDVTMYRTGGHHPVNLGDILGHKFKVIHKLGNGGFAIVWLARDLDQKRCVALKILRADAPDHEIKVLRHLKTATGSILSPITHLYELFTIHGPNGIHQCLVLSFGGPSLKHLRVYCKQLDPPLLFLKAAARSLVDSLTAIHSAGVYHGDLTHSNILFEITDSHHWTEDDVYRYLGPPKIAPLLLLNGLPAPPFAPTHVVDALDYSHLKLNQLSGNILITDFGEAFFKDNIPKGLGTQICFYSPELFFGYPPSYAVDLWALGCLIFEIYTFRILIPTGFGSPGEAVAMAVETIGALPEEWQGLCKDMSLDTKSGEKHRWFDNRLERAFTLDSRLLQFLPELSQDQHAVFLHLLRSILVFQPSHRLPAAEVRKHPWFADLH